MKVGGRGSAHSPWLPGVLAQGKVRGPEPGAGSLALSVQVVCLEECFLSRGPSIQRVSATPTRWTEGNHRPGQLDTLVMVLAGRKDDGAPAPGAPRPQDEGSLAGSASMRTRNWLPAPTWHELPPVPPDLAQSGPPLCFQGLGKCQARPGVGNKRLDENRPHCCPGSGPRDHCPFFVANGTTVTSF